MRGEVVMRRLATFEVVMLAAMVVLFGVAVAQALGYLSGETAYRPIKLVLLTAGLVLQPVAALVARRSRVGFYLLLALSMVLLWRAFVATS